MFPSLLGTTLALNYLHTLNNNSKRVGDVSCSGITLYWHHFPVVPGWESFGAQEPFTVLPVLHQEATDKNYIYIYIYLFCMLEGRWSVGRDARVFFLSYQPVGFVIFDSRAGAEAARSIERE